jgi:hypothetical protein
MDPGSKTEKHASEPPARLAEDLPADQKYYLDNRFDQYTGWYNGKAVRTKAQYLRMRTVAVVGGAIVPVLVNVPWHYIKIATTSISLLVVVLLSLESVYHYREQWKNYRSTEQFLGHEKVYFLNRVGFYEGLSDDRAFKLFVDRVEAAIASENAATLNTMTLAAEAANKDVLTSRIPE